MDDYIEDFVIATVACFLKNEAFEEILKGNIELGEPLFNAFDGFSKGVRAPLFLLK